MQESVLELMQSMGHEQVVFCQDPKTGLNAIIAIHNTTLGPSLGGTRLWNYKSHDEALIDALRLSRGMTYKSAISGLNLGGGKAVLIGDAAQLKNEAYWRRYGKFVNSLHGKYITAEDVNTSSRDMEYIGMETEFVTGMPDYMGGSGDPSPLTAYGVYMGMKAAAKKAWGSDSLTGKKILVQGAGNVGQYLMGHLVSEDATVYICDINDDKLKQAVHKYPSLKVVLNENIFDLDIDIYAPCALGATVNTESINKMKCL
jgi:leucine dehydrogenase